MSGPGPSGWFNPAAFDQPPDFTIGNISRTHPNLRNPGSQNFDLSMTKRLTLAAERTLELSLAAFNFVNHANWNDPDNVIGPKSAPNVNAGNLGFGGWGFLGAWDGDAILGKSTVRVAILPSGQFQ